MNDSQSLTGHLPVHALHAVEQVVQTHTRVVERVRRRNVDDPAGELSGTGCLEQVGEAPERERVGRRVGLAGGHGVLRATTV